MDNVFVETNNQKVLKFLVENNVGFKTAREIQDNLAISKGGLNTSLRSLLEKGLVGKEAKGKVHLYRANLEHPVVKQFKILNSIERLQPLIEALSSHSQRIVLFGSVSRGEDLPESDIDLLILGRDKEKIKEDLRAEKVRGLKPIIKTPFEWAETKDRDADFYLEVEKGVVLYERDE